MGFIECAVQNTIFHHYIKQNNYNQVSPQISTYSCKTKDIYKNIPLMQTLPNYQQWSRCLDPQKKKLQNNFTKYYIPFFMVNIAVTDNHLFYVIF
jgi:hypothetical protein